MESQIIIVILACFLTGMTSLILSINLLGRYRRTQNIGALLLALTAASLGVGNLLWFIEDAFFDGTPALGKLAWIMVSVFPVYFSVVFSLNSVGIKNKFITGISTFIAILGVASFVVLPLSQKEFGGVLGFIPNPITKLVLIAVAIMGFVPIFLWGTYAVEMGKVGRRIERDRGIMLAAGFLITLLGENILLTHTKTSLLVCCTMDLVGVIILYVAFTRTKV